MEERDLVIRSQQGDRQAFGELVRKYQAYLRAYASRYMLSSEDVFDLVQDSFLDALQHIEDFDKDRDLLPWLRGICRNRVLNHFRARRTKSGRCVALVDEAIEARIAVQPDEAEDATERVRSLRVCMEELESTQREMMRMRYELNAPVKEIAAKLGRSAASLSMILGRVRKALSRCVELRMAQNGAR